MLRLPVRTLQETRVCYAKPPSSWAFRHLSFSQTTNTRHESTPGWKGRTPDDHVVHRKDELDVQSQASQSGMREHESGNSESQGLNRKDEGQYNKKAKQDHPKAPEPVIGMNDESESRRSRLLFVPVICR